MLAIELGFPSIAGKGAVAVKIGVKAGKDAAVALEKKFGEALAKDTVKTGIIGTRGVKTASTTIWKGNGKNRLDVENPNPGQRPGQIHYQDSAGNKYLYNPLTKSFPGAPRSVNKLLRDSKFSQAIDKGLKKYLGEQP